LKFGADQEKLVDWNDNFPSRLPEKIEGYCAEVYPLYPKDKRFKEAKEAVEISSP
jgi:hypothetical protein